MDASQLATHSNETYLSCKRILIVGAGVGGCVGGVAGRLTGGPGLLNVLLTGRAASKLARCADDQAAVSTAGAARRLQPEQYDAMRASATSIRSRGGIPTGSREYLAVGLPTCWQPINYFEMSSSRIRN